MDERELDPQIGAEARAAIRAEHEQDRHLVGFYLHYWQRVFRGDLGTSRSLKRPVLDLLRERLPVTARHVAKGLLIAWIGGAGLVLLTVWRGSQLIAAAAGAATAFLLCLPSALIALALFLLGYNPAWAIALVLLPQVFFFLRAELRRTAKAPYLLTARAKGLPPWRILCWHILPSAVPAILALAGLSIPLAFGAAIPIESFADIPGLGQLTWQAASRRDLPLLVNLLLCLTAFILIANQAADWAGQRWWGKRS